MGELLGQGMHASVHKCYRIEDTEKAHPMAVKIVREEDEEKIEIHKAEFEIMKKLDNPNITKAHELFVNEFKKLVHIVMDFVDGTEIFDSISELGVYSEQNAQEIFKQIMSGIEYLHSLGICHRDIKPSNILVTKDNEVKIIDFNVARNRKEGESEFKMMTKTGTLAYCAPEIFTSTYYK